MSDVPLLGAHLQWKLAIERSSLAYACKSTTNNVLFAVDIPYPLLRACRDELIWSITIREHNSNMKANRFMMNLKNGGASVPIWKQIYKNYMHKGKDISEVIKKSRTLKKYLSRANVALWFSRSFGLQVESLIVSEVKSGFDALSVDDKSKVEKVLFLLDRFCVGDHFYHELSMVINGLPKSYLVKQRRDQLNKMCHINALPGDQEGAQVSFKELLKERVQNYITSHPNIISDGVPLRVKISGDGANMTRSSNYILMTFGLLDASEDIMAANGNHTIAVVKGKEDYDVLKESFKDILRDINEVVAEKKIDVDEGTVNLEFFLGGDYKFILLMIGLSGATSNHACIGRRHINTNRNKTVCYCIKKFEAESTVKRWINEDLAKDNEKELVYMSRKLMHLALSLWSFVQPKRASGTRWISFKLAALSLDKFGIYLTHLENLAEQEGNAEIVGVIKDLPGRRYRY
ncbi:Hypothetical predicted protein, partial [Paramuricea clavata]